MRPKVYIATDHDIDPSHIDADAFYVIKKLQEAGHTAYIVGGCVRDLLSNHSPKDFDIATSAEPEEVKDIFKRRCLLIGRRFRLAHVRFGHKIIEVATFRSGDNESDLIVRDNTWGTPEEDAMRRDFTMNGLFYDPSTHEIIDYVGGWDDIHNRIIQSIGDPMTRFQQDPVRMIRLLKFRARFGFKISPECKDALLKSTDLIKTSSQARVLEEIFRMLESGASAAFFNLLKEAGFLEVIFPMLMPHFNGKSAGKILQNLSAADELQNNPHYPELDRSVLLACLLYPILEEQIKIFSHKHQKIPHLGEIHMLSCTIIKDFVLTSFVRVPKKISAVTNHVLSSQYRFTPLKSRVQFRNSLFQNRSFPMAMRFLRIRSMIDGSLVDTYELWKSKFKHFRQQQDHRGPHHPPPRKRRRGRKGSGS